MHFSTILSIEIIVNQKLMFLAVRNVLRVSKSVFGLRFAQKFSHSEYAAPEADLQL